MDKRDRGGRRDNEKETRRGQTSLLDGGDVARVWRLSLRAWRRQSRQPGGRGEGGVAAAERPLSTRRKKGARKREDGQLKADV